MRNRTIFWAASSEAQKGNGLAADPAPKRTKIILWRDLQLTMWLIMAHDNFGSRVAQARVLPGRQYLRVSDSKATYSPMTLLELVNRARRHSCKDLKDHIGHGGEV